MYRLANELEFPVIIAGLSDNCLINCLSFTVFSLGLGLPSMDSSIAVDSLVPTSSSLMFSFDPISSECLRGKNMSGLDLSSSSHKAKTLALLQLKNTLKLGLQT